VHGDAGARILSDAQTLVLEALSSELPVDEIALFRWSADIYRSGIDRPFARALSQPLPLRMLRAACGPRDGRGPQSLRRAPGRWLLFDPWRDRLGAVSRDDAVDILREGIVTAIADRHVNALVKSSTLAWLHSRGKLSLHDPAVSAGAEGLPAR